MSKGEAKSYAGIYVQVVYTDIFYTHLTCIVSVVQDKGQGENETTVMAIYCVCGLRSIHSIPLYLEGQGGVSIRSKQNRSTLQQ